MKTKLLLALSLIVLPHCSTMVDTNQRRFLDSTFHSDLRPGWAEGTKSVWEEKGFIKYRGFQSIKGTERVNGCYELARLEAKQLLTAELNTDLKGKIDMASQSVSENAELLVAKSISEVFGNQIRGLRFTDEFFERYMVANIERVDCHVLGELSFSDYMTLKRNVVDRILAVDPRIREAVAQQQIKFFNGDREDEREIQGYPPITPQSEKKIAKPNPKQTNSAPTAKAAEPSNEAVKTEELNQE